MRAVKAKQLREIARKKQPCNELNYDIKQHTKMVPVMTPVGQVSIPVSVYTASLKLDTQRKIYQYLKKGA